jgi:hypothetical protein
VLPVGGLGWGWRWPEEGCPQEQWGDGVEVARRRPSGKAGVAWGGRGASRGHGKPIQELDSGGSGVEGGARWRGRAMVLMVWWWWCSDVRE